MNIQFVKLSPTQNITLLVLSRVPHVNQSLVASALMRADGDAEQVGFLESPRLDGARMRLQMMGGEFCGNASMAVAAYLSSLDGLRNGQNATIPLEVSGAEGLVVCGITASDGGFEGTVDMPLPRSVERRALRYGGTVYNAQCVDMRGILHIILPSGTFQNDGLAEAALKEWSCLFEADAVGLILFDENTGQIRPLVYVPSAGSLVWERGCGSGSAAVGCYLAVRNGREICRAVSQPGGVITVRASAVNGLPDKLSITGMVYVDGKVRKAVVEA